MTKPVIFLVYIFINFFILDSCFSNLDKIDKYEKSYDYIDHSDSLHNLKIKNTHTNIKKNNYAINVFDYDKSASKRNWITPFMKNDFWNTYYSLSSSISNPWHLIAFPINFVVTGISKFFFDDNINRLFFQKLNLLVYNKHQSVEFRSYLENNIKIDTSFYEKNIRDNQDIASCIGVTNLINFRNEFQKQIANDIDSEKFLINRIDDFIDNYKLKNGLNLEEYYKSTLKYKILAKLGLKDKTFEEQRTREFLFTYLKTSIMFSLDAKYAYEYTIFRNNFFYTQKDCDFVSEFSDFKHVFSGTGKYKNSDFYDMMDYFAWRIAMDDEMQVAHKVPSLTGDNAINYADNIIPGTLPETNKIFSNSLMYGQVDFCLRCGSLGQKLVRWGISGTFFCISYNVLLKSLAKSGFFWAGSSVIMTSITAPIIAGFVLKHKKTKGFNNFMKENFVKNISMNDENSEAKKIQNINKQDGKKLHFLDNNDFDLDKLHAENKAKTNAKLFNIAKYQEKMILENSGKNVAVKIPVLENIMNEYKNYIISNQNSSKSMNKLTNEFKQKLRENDFEMMRDESARASNFSDKFTKIFSKMFDSIMNFFVGDKDSVYMNYQQKYNYVAKIIDSIEDYAITASYHESFLNMYQDFIELRSQENFSEFFEKNWESYINSEMKEKITNDNFYTIKKEFKDYALEHIILDGVYMNGK